MKPYFQRDNVTLFLGRTEDVLPTLPSGLVDLVITSPPYNLGVSSGGGIKSAKNSGKWAGAALCDAYSEYDDAQPWPEYVAWQKDILTQCWRVIGDTGAIFYNHKPRVQNGELWDPIQLNPGLPLRQRIIWKRAGGINFSPTHYLPTHEYVLLFARPAFRLKSKGASGPGDVWEFAQESNNPHPAPFPLGLPLRALETTGAKSVLDPFAGSGTTLLAAKLMGARGVGIEISEKYAEQAAKRLSQGVLALESVS